MILNALGIVIVTIILALILVVCSTAYEIFKTYKSVEIKRRKKVTSILSHVAGSIVCIGIIIFLISILPQLF